MSTKLLQLFMLGLMTVGTLRLSAQNVGMGTATPNASAMLDITSTNRGLLIPRVALSSTTVAAPVVAPSNALLVYNTATAGDVTPGFYYWATASNQWVRMADKVGWEIVGNSGIVTPLTPGTYGVSPIAANENWLGTRDYNALVIGTNGTERLRVSPSGNVGIGTANPTDQLDVYEVNNSNKSSIYVYAGQLSTTSSYQNRAIVGVARGGNATFGYAIGVSGIAVQANSRYATGVYASLGTSLPLSIQNDQALFANGANLGFAGIFMNGNVGLQTPTPSEQLEIGGVNAKIFMNSGTSNMIQYNSNGIGAPAYTTQSVGTKLVLYPQLSGTNTDYALGIEPNCLWSSIPAPLGVYQHKWYAGTTELMRLSGDYRLCLGTTTPLGTRLSVSDPSVGVSRVAVFKNGAASGTEVQVGSIEYLHDYASTTDFNNGGSTVGLSINYGAASSYDLQLRYDLATKPGTSTWTIASDERLKEDIHPFKDGLDALRQINPIYYKYNGKGRTPKDEYYVGIIAQDMQKIAPYMIGTWEAEEVDTKEIHEYLSYNAHALNYITVNAIKEIDKKQTKITQIFTNISDFGTITANQAEIFIPYHTDFVHHLDAQTLPVVTVTAIQSETNLSIVSQNMEGFTVKMSHYTQPVQFNWIAMAKVKLDELDSKPSYTETERQEMLNKVIIPKRSIREKIELEKIELAKFHTSLKEAEEKDKINKINSKMPNSDTPISTPDPVSKDAKE